MMRRLIRFPDLNSLYELAATVIGTSNPPHDVAERIIEAMRAKRLQLQYAYDAHGSLAEKGHEGSMTSHWLVVSLAVAAAAAPTMGLAQQAPHSQFPDQQPSYSDELSPRQIQSEQDPDSLPDPKPPRAQAPKQTRTPKQQQAPKPPQVPRQAQASKRRQAPKRSAAQSARTVTCGGAFAKESSHAKLTTIYGSENVAFAEVDTSDGSKQKASVLFPKDPAQRLEVWWENETERTNTYLIVINGQSTWSAPNGLRLGLQLAIIERLNGKPFKLKGLGKDSDGSVSDWQDGTLASPMGGCKIGVSLRSDPRAQLRALNRSDSEEFASNDSAIKAMKPTISEIIIGY